MQEHLRSLFLFLHHIAVLGFLECLHADGMCLMIKEARRVIGATIDAGFEMQVLCSGTTCATCQGYHITSFYSVAHLHQILGVVTIVGLQAITMQDAHQIAITCILGGKDHLAIKRSTYLVVWLGL